VGTEGTGYSYKLNAEGSMGPMLQLIADRSWLIAGASENPIYSLGGIIDEGLDDKQIKILNFRHFSAF